MVNAIHPAPGNTIPSELAMSDEEFRENYIAENEKWLRIYAEQTIRVHGRIPCAGMNSRRKMCGRNLTATTIRPWGGVNYCPTHFRDRILEEMKSSTGANLRPDRFEWATRVMRVMDKELYERTRI